MAKLTLEQIEEIQKNKTYYHVIYENVDGSENIQIRDTVQRAFLLYEREAISRKPKGRLEEVRSDGSRVVLRGYSSKTSQEILIEAAQKREEEERRRCNKKSVLKPLIQALLGDVSYNEYKTAVLNFARLHNATPDEWGLNL